MLMAFAVSWLASGWFNDPFLGLATATFYTMGSLGLMLIYEGHKHVNPLCWSFFAAGAFLIILACFFMEFLWWISSA